MAANGRKADAFERLKELIHSIQGPGPFADDFTKVRVFSFASLTVRSCITGARHLSGSVPNIGTGSVPQHISGDTGS
jgi:hypothetical protein